MVSVISAGVGSEIAVHPGWLDLVIPEVEDPALRDALFKSERLAPRIRHAVLDLVLKDQGVTETPADLGPEVTALVQSWGAPLLRRIGLLWFAPVLAQRLIDAKRHDEGRGVTKAEMRLLLRFSTHTAASLVANIPQAPDYEHHGALCLAAWLDHLGGQGASLKAALPPLVDDGGFDDEARAQFVAQLLVDPTVFEGLNDDPH